MSFNDDLQYLASTKRSLSALAGGRSCTLPCVSLYFVKSDIVILFSFHCVLAAVCKLSIFLSFFLFVIAEDCDAYTTLLSSVQVMIALRFYTTGTF